MRHVWFVACVVIGGCKSTPNCEDAIKKAADKVPALADPTRLSGAVAECIKDKWSDETRTCIANVHDEPDLVACALRQRSADRTNKIFGESKVDTAKMTVHRFAYEAFPMWQRSHSDKGCPEKLEDLSDYMDTKDTKDPWRNPYKMMCGQTLPAGAKGGFAVLSPGEDGQEGTADDIKSWE